MKNLWIIILCVLMFASLIGSCVAISYSKDQFTAALAAFGMIMFYVFGNSAKELVEGRTKKLLRELDK